jgi:uncharacterized protein CbrC (UPF0167 family)
MADPLPSFRFHPDPRQSGSVASSTAPCAVCGLARGWLYQGPCFGPRDLDGRLCPWCIADGRAHTATGVTFTDLDLPDAATAADCDELEQRTPGFATVNPFVWPLCCGAPMAFLEPCGIAELRARHRSLEGELMATIVHDLGRSGGAAKALLAALRRDEAPTAYVFGCTVCETRTACLDLP